MPVKKSITLKLFEEKAKEIEEAFDIPMHGDKKTKILRITFENSSVEGHSRILVTIHV